MGNAVYRDLIQALIMVQVDHLVLAVPNAYKIQDRRSKRNQYRLLEHGSGRDGALRAYPRGDAVRAYADRLLGLSTARLLRPALPFRVLALPLLRLHPEHLLPNRCRQSHILASDGFPPRAATMSRQELPGVLGHRSPTRR